MEIQEDPDCQGFIKNMENVNLVEKKYCVPAGINDHRFQYFMLLEKNNNDIIYKWDTDTDEVKEFGTLFDFLKYYRQITIVNMLYFSYGVDSPCRTILPYYLYCLRLAALYEK